MSGRSIVVSSQLNRISFSAASALRPDPETLSNSAPSEFTHAGGIPTDKTNGLNLLSSVVGLKCLSG